MSRIVASGYILGGAVLKQANLLDELGRDYERHPRIVPVAQIGRNTHAAQTVEADTVETDLGSIVVLEQRAA